MFRELLVRHQGPKQVGVDVLNLYRESKDRCVFVGLYCDDWKDVFVNTRL
jgi:hypothetical protein